MENNKQDKWDGSLFPPTIDTIKSEARKLWRLVYADWAGLSDDGKEEKLADEAYEKYMDKFKPKN